LRSFFSNAHYYLHYDEEVIRLLSALATSSQRMAQSRAADERFGGLITPIQATTGPTNIRPIDIPTSPPLPMGSPQAQFALQQATALLQQNPQQQRAFQQQQRPAHTLARYASLPLPSVRRPQVSDSESRSASEAEMDEE